MRLWRNPAPRPESAGSLTPGGGKAGLARFQQGAAREYFDVPGLICGLNGENLHDFAEMRVKLRYESAGYDQTAVSFSMRYVVSCTTASSTSPGNSNGVPLGMAVAGSHCDAAACAQMRGASSDQISSFWERAN